MGDSIAIETNNLSFAHNRDRLALDRVSFRITHGEKVAVIGPNGAGKTTLFLCLAGVLPLRPGLVRVAGLDPANRNDRRKLPTRLGIVFQESDDQIFNATVYDDVAFGPINLGLPAETVQSRVASALAQVGLAGYEDRVPFHLSGGEKRRVALAGVLAMSPSLLLLDEPTIFLDPRGRREFIQLLQRIDATRILATHDLELVVETCDRVMVLDQGRIIADGSPRCILANQQLMDEHGLEVPYSLRR